jgi:hypothetical protein
VTALSTLCSAPVPLVDELLQSKHREAILIACKAAELEGLRPLRQSPPPTARIPDDGPPNARSEQR